MSAEDFEAAEESPIVPEVRPLIEPPRPASLMPTAEAMPEAALDLGIRPLIEPPRPLDPAPDTTATSEPVPRQTAADPEPPAPDTPRDADDGRGFSILSGREPIEAIEPIPDETPPQPERWDAMAEAREQAQFREAEDVDRRDALQVADGDSGSMSGGLADEGGSSQDGDLRQPTPEIGRAAEDGATSAEADPQTFDGTAIQEPTPTFGPPGPEASSADDGALETPIAAGDAVADAGAPAVGETGADATALQDVETSGPEFIQDAGEQVADAAPDAVSGPAEPPAEPLAAAAAERASDTVPEEGAAAYVPEPANAAADDAVPIQAVGSGAPADGSAANATSEPALDTSDASDSTGDVPVPTSEPGFEEAGPTAETGPDAAALDDRGFDTRGQGATADGADQLPSVEAPLATDAVAEEPATPGDAVPGPELVRDLGEQEADAAPESMTAQAEPPVDAPAGEAAEVAGDTVPEEDTAASTQQPTIAADVEPRAADGDGTEAQPDPAVESAVESGEQPDGRISTVGLLDQELLDREPAAQAREAEPQDLGEEDARAPADATGQERDRELVQVDALREDAPPPVRSAIAADASGPIPEDPADAEASATEPQESPESGLEPEASSDRNDVLPDPASAVDGGGTSLPQPELGSEMDDAPGAEAPPVASADAIGDAPSEADDRATEPPPSETGFEDPAATDDRPGAAPQSDAVRVGLDDATIANAERAGGEAEVGEAEADTQAIDQSDRSEAYDHVEDPEAMRGTSDGRDAIPDEAADGRRADEGEDRGDGEEIRPDDADGLLRADRAEEDDRPEIDAGLARGNTEVGPDTTQPFEDRPADEDRAESGTDPQAEGDEVRPSEPDPDASDDRETASSEEGKTQASADRDRASEEDRLAQEVRAEERCDQEKDGQEEVEPASDKLERLEQERRDLAELDAQRTEQDRLGQDPDERARLKEEAEALASVDEKLRDEERAALEEQKTVIQEVEREAQEERVEESLKEEQPEPGHLEQQGRELKQLDEARRDEAKLADDPLAQARLEEEGRRIQELDQQRLKQERDDQARLAQQEQDQARARDEQREQARLDQERDDTSRRDAQDAARRQRLAAPAAAERSEAADPVRDADVEARPRESEPAAEPAPTIVERRDVPDGGTRTGAPAALATAERAFEVAENIARATRSDHRAREVGTGTSANGPAQPGPQAARVDGGESAQPGTAPGLGSVAIAEDDATPAPQPASSGAGAGAGPPARSPPASSDELLPEPWDDGPSARPPRGLSPIPSEDPLPEFADAPGGSFMERPRVATSGEPPPARSEERRLEDPARKLDLDALTGLFGQSNTCDFEPLLAHTKLRDGWLGELIPRVWLDHMAGLKLTPLQNKSNHGADGLYIDPESKTIVFAEMKWSKDGPGRAEGVSERSPEDRLYDWVPARLEKNSSWQAVWAETPNLYNDLCAAMASGEFKVVGIHVRIGPTIEDGKRVQKFIVDEWPNSNPTDRPREEWTYGYRPEHIEREPIRGID